jgi:hypothetical protein
MRRSPLRYLTGAVLPLARFQNLEFRVGYNLIADVQKHTARNVVYGAVRISFEPAGFGQMRRWQRHQSREKSPHTLFLLRSYVC